MKIALRRLAVSIGVTALSMTAVVPPTAASAPNRQAPTVVLTPMLGQFPYDPVLDGTTFNPDLGGEVGDPNDCSITGYESWNGDDLAVQGCTRALLFMNWPAQTGLDDWYRAYGSAQVTATYGCINRTTNAERVTITRSGTARFGDTGFYNSAMPAYIPDTPVTTFWQGSRVQVKHTCRASEQPAQLSLVFHCLTVRLVGYDYDLGRQVVVRQYSIPGSWWATHRGGAGSSTS